MSTPNARTFAISKHGDQRYGKQPYVFHLDMCARLLIEETVYGDDSLFIFENLCVLLPAVYLHDILEDTATSKQHLEELFGSDVADIVYLVTDPPGRNRKERKAQLIQKMLFARETLSKYITWAAMGVKLIDRVCNVNCCKGLHDESRLKMYRDEQAEFRKLYVPGENESLWQRLEKALA